VIDDAARASAHTPANGVVVDVVAVDSHTMDG
jgi:hypothetical protein